MHDAGPCYCDVALPVPVDRLFTYELSPTLRHRVQIGCRVIAPFGTRKLTGVVLRTHSDVSGHELREVLSLRDEEPVLNEELLQLARWIAEYYCAPIGEVLKSMLPLSGETRRSTEYSLTDRGRDVARQLVIGSESDPASKVLALLEERPRSGEYLGSKIDRARTAVRALVKRGWVAAEDKEDNRDPRRAPAERLQAEFIRRAPQDLNLKKSERELLAFLELHPGPHNVAELRGAVKNASPASRALARLELVSLEIEGLGPSAAYDRAIPILNSEQEQAFRAIASALDAKEYRGFLLHGVTGSGKTEVYLRAIEATLNTGRNALLLVPEIGLTPAVAGQFFHRFGKQVAILHSAFGDAERADQWRRIRDGRARVVVGTRSGVFAPIQNLGLVVVDEEHDGSYKQQETPRYHGRDVAIVRARNAGAVAILGSATPSVETRYNAEQGKYTLLTLPERIAQRRIAASRDCRHARGVPRNKKAGGFLAEVAGGNAATNRAARTDHAAAQPPRLFEFHGLPLLRRAVIVQQLLRCAHASSPR